MNEDWTPDTILAALPTPEVRQTFLRELNLTKFKELPALGRRWGRYVEDLQAGVARGIELRAYQQAHGGALPETYVDATELVQDHRAA